jgi:hypothetical protein
VLPVVFDMFLFWVESTAWRGVALLFVPELDLTLSGSSPHYSPIAYREKQCERESGDIMNQEDRERGRDATPCVYPSGLALLFYTTVHWKR